MSKGHSSSESKPTEVELDYEAQKVIDFKLEWLLRAGFSVGNAEKIASAPHVDWHTAVDLLPVVTAHGYDESFLVEILT